MEVIMIIIKVILTILIKARVLFEYSVSMD